MTASILIVDDSRIARRIVRSVLSDEGDFDIREAADGHECLAACQAQMPDLVLLDLTMPDMDGFETLSRLKEINPDIKVAVVSADVQHASRRAVEEMGAVAFLRKPIDGTEVRDLIRRLLRDRV